MREVVVGHGRASLHPNVSLLRQLVKDARLQRLHGTELSTLRRVPEDSIPSESHLTVVPGVDRIEPLTKHLRPAEVSYGAQRRVYH